ncbi:hypothetical protein TcarDRAFT_1684 [Thermosinus carboxydivorans Nor1]|uniref:Uncharacterized protein n=1 Tax=Thermosinus carboxydivorans Nor1 TaxID=401526 RepID=A1HP29_9FIRM|nr:hypothetical protein [Thermosinus carboxydivorans]EAX48137.1 hypothetical protein TcarDRAFT_1684 [Thermosinus carboxydivorans Nor1]
MGFFDSLFGGGKKAEAPKKEKKKKAAPVPADETAEPAQASGLTPEIIAAISASVNMVLADESDPAVVAAVVAAIAHAQGGVRAVRFKRTNNIWAVTGRQKIMDSRQFV